MEVKAVAKNVRLSAQKCRLVADQIRDMPIERALELLEFSTKKGSGLLKKVLDSAIANAEHNEGADVDELWVSQLMIDEAATFKRLRARAKGRGDHILKRNCHITVVLRDDDRTSKNGG